MRTLKRTLQDLDPTLLPLLAARWGVPIQNLSTPEVIAALEAAMLERERAEVMWESLDEEQRGTLQTLLGSGGKMPARMFNQLFGEVRQMGAAQIAREQPHLRPANSAEALYYRGLLAQAFEQAEAGPRPMIYVPTDLAAVLPSHKTGYDDLADAPTPSEGPVRLEPLDEVDDARQADTSLVDDMTTLLAYIQIHGADAGDEGQHALAAALKPHLLNRDPARLDFLIGLALGAALIEAEAGRLIPRRAEMRRWLAESRAAQVRLLAEGWRTAALYRDLWHVPGLYPEPTGWHYDPVVARGAIIRMLGELAPEGEWWALDEFIEVVKRADPDFQRPGGDYSSWYIRNDAGEYLQGFESWDSVEGALLEFYITGPMHWLGLADLAEDAARLTAYGRAFVGLMNWPTPPDPEDRISIDAEGVFSISRRVSRMDRFQAARFTTWLGVGDPFTYRLDGAGIQTASAQGINTGHIAAFIGRALGDAPPPPKISALLENWRAGPSASVTLERLLVLRTTAPETLDTLLKNPALRRYLGAQLGPMAVIVRADQADALRAALGEAGIEAELIGG